MKTCVFIIVLWGLSLCLGGCQQSSVRGDLSADDAPERISAFVDVSNHADDDELAELIHALLDDDPAVRLFAIQSLHANSGQTLGYQFYAPTDERNAAASRWRDWLEAGRPTTPANVQQVQAPSPSLRDRAIPHD